MLLFQKYFSVSELERLHKEDLLPRGDILATARRYMDHPNSVLLLVRDESSWEIRGVFVDLPEAEFPAHRRIYCIYAGIDGLPVKHFVEYLRASHFAMAELHLPATCLLEDEAFSWTVMRHHRQAVGVLKAVQLVDGDTLPQKLRKIKNSDDVTKMEIHIATPLRLKERDITRELNALGFATRKYIYHLVPQ